LPESGGVHFLFERKGVRRGKKKKGGEKIKRKKERRDMEGLRRGKKNYMKIR